MARSVIMPKAGMTMEEGTIVRWLKKPGDSVTRGEPIAIIETDKATMDLEAEEVGTLLEIVHGDGAAVKATQTIAWIGAPGEKVDATNGDAPHASESVRCNATGPEAAAHAAQGAPALCAPTARVPATPAARRVAAETGILLTSVKGTGPGGVVRTRDVAAATEAAAQTFVPMSRPRHARAINMLCSHQFIPSVTLVMRADVTGLVDLLSQINARKVDLEISSTDFVVRAVAAALRGNPLLNSVVEEEHLVLKDEVNVGVALVEEGSHVVPVIDGADRLSVRQISERLRDLVARARAGTLTPDDCGGGTFTVTNLGIYGITEVAQLINVPESAILGIGAPEEVLRRSGDGTIGSRQLMSLCLTHDHRHIDDAPAAVFLGRLRVLLEHCVALLA